MIDFINQIGSIISDWTNAYGQSAPNQGIEWTNQQNESYEPHSSSFQAFSDFDQG